MGIQEMNVTNKRPTMMAPCTHIAQEWIKKKEKESLVGQGVRAAFRLKGAGIDDGQVLLPSLPRFSRTRAHHAEAELWQ